MRIALCFRRNGNIYRLVLLTESTNGIYLVVFGGQQQSHISYHQDGTRHIRMDSEYHNRFSDVPIASHSGVRQIDHLSMSMTKEWFSAATAYPGDEKTETLVLLDEALFHERDTLAVDVWLLDRASEPQLFATIGKILTGDSTFHIVGEVVAALDHYPEHKLALTLRSARVRGVDL